MATTADPYNWKSLQRKDLMSLSGINPVDERKRKFKGGVDTYRDYSYNLFNMDIIGRLVFIIIQVARLKNSGF